jgi:OOP family OmpA-OmpF porin
MAVASYLLKKGVRSDQLVVKGFGYHQPSSSNRTEEGRRLNRRVELKQSR